MGNRSEYYLGDQVQKRIVYHFGRIMEALEIPITEGNVDTPDRIARMYLEIFENRNVDSYKWNEFIKNMTLFKTDYKNGELHQPITIHGIHTCFFCEHHWLPAIGSTTITYVPDTHILGLSKFPRAVQFFCKKPQIQEKLTNEIGRFLVDILRPLSLEIAMSCRHTCVEARGIKDINSETVTKFKY